MDGAFAFPVSCRPGRSDSTHCSVNSVKSSTAVTTQSALEQIEFGPLASRGRQALPKQLSVDKT